LENRTESYKISQISNVRFKGISRNLQRLTLGVLSRSPNVRNAPKEDKRVNTTVIFHSSKPRHTIPAVRLGFFKIPKSSSPRWFYLSGKFN